MHTSNRLYERDTSFRISGLITIRFLDCLQADSHRLAEPDGGMPSAAVDMVSWLLPFGSWQFESRTSRKQAVPGNEVGIVFVPAANGANRTSTSSCVRACTPAPNTATSATSGASQQIRR